MGRCALPKKKVKLPIWKKYQKDFFTLYDFSFIGSSIYPCMPSIYAVLLSRNRNIIKVSHKISPIASVGAFFSGIIFMQASEVGDFA